MYQPGIGWIRCHFSFLLSAQCINGLIDLVRNDVTAINRKVTRLLQTAADYYVQYTSNPRAEESPRYPELQHKLAIWLPLFLPPSHGFCQDLTCELMLELTAARRLFCPVGCVLELIVCCHLQEPGHLPVDCHFFFHRHNVSDKDG